MLINELPPNSGTSVQPADLLGPVSADEKEFGYSPNFLDKSVLTLESWVAFGTYESPEIESKCISVGIFNVRS